MTSTPCLGLPFLLTIWQQWKTVHATVRIIKPSYLVDSARRHPNARPSLQAWKTAVEAANWRKFSDVRATFATADTVKVQSGKTVVVFNISGNGYRLICAIHYNRHLVFTLFFLTHAEYDKDRWKSDL
jgi:mRNA interferase HigB